MTKQEAQSLAAEYAKAFNQECYVYEDRSGNWGTSSDRPKGVGVRYVLKTKPNGTITTCL